MSRRDRRPDFAPPPAAGAAGGTALIRPWLAAVVLAAGLAGCQPTPPPPAQPALGPPPSPQGEGVPERGREVAEQWCAPCHRIARTQRRVANPAENAPPFAELARRWGGRPDELRHFMDDLHLPMPTFRLWPQERDDVVAYIESLDRTARR